MTNSSAQHLHKTDRTGNRKSKDNHNKGRAGNPSRESTYIFSHRGNSIGRTSGRQGHRRTSGRIPTRPNTAEHIAHTIQQLHKHTESLPEKTKTQKETPWSDTTVNTSEKIGNNRTSSQRIHLSKQNREIRKRKEADNI